MTPDERTAELKELIPGSIQGWNVQITRPLPAKEDLYDYIDGAAELYISYGFGGALSCTYTKEDQPEVIVDIYDLIETRNAFGVFSQTRETENVQLGQGAFSMPGAIFFWKDHYYISISAWESSEEIENLILKLGKYIDKRILSTGKKPELLKLLPEKELVPYGYMYFHHYIWLNSYYFISNDNILNIGDETDAVLAKYSEAQNRRYLLIVQYKDQDAAAKAFASFGSVYFPNGLEENCIRLENNKWMAAGIMDKNIAVVLGGSTRNQVNTLLMKVIGKHVDYDFIENT